MEMAHQAAYNRVCATVDKVLIAKQGVLKVTDLLQEYVSCLQESNSPNPNYRSEKLREKLFQPDQECISSIGSPALALHSKGLGCL